MSAQFDQTCAVASQSMRQPSTYLPAGRSEGTLRTSLTACVWSLPSAPLSGGGYDGVLLLSQRLQSLPAVCGHGTHGPFTLLASPGRQRFGVLALSCVPGMQRGPDERQTAGNPDDTA